MKVNELIAIGVQPTQARAFAAPITAAFARFDVNSLEQQAGFLAQAMHESRRFTCLEEDLHYTTAGRVQQIWPTRFPSLAQTQAVLRRPELLANTVYSNLNGNGDFASGDGWRYRGRGLFQLTCRDNYAAAAADIGRDYIGHPSSSHSRKMQR